MDEKALSEDLDRASEAARAAIEPAIRRLEADGVAVGSLRPCEAEARDGTKLGGCAKHYIPQPDGRWGAVFSIELEGSTPVLMLLSVGERHPSRPWKPSVYEIAHRRFNRSP